MSSTSGVHGGGADEIATKALAPTMGAVNVALERETRMGNGVS